MSVVLCATALYGQIDYVSARRERRLKPMKTSERITIDGALDEAAWSRSEAATDFTQTEPEPEQAASQLRGKFTSRNRHNSGRMSVFADEPGEAEQATSGAEAPRIFVAVTARLKAAPLRESHGFGPGRSGL